MLKPSAVARDVHMDRRIGLDIERVEAQLTFLSLVDRYGSRYTAPNDHSWLLHAELWRRMNQLGVRSVLDLGAGYGRLLFYGALVHGTSGTGIEIVAERVREARRVGRALGLNALNFQIGDILSATWPQADCICVLNPVTPSERPALLRRLRHVANEREVLVASVSILNPLLCRQSWLRRIDVDPADPLGVQICRSITRSRRTHPDLRRITG
jgi:SAM-dependent methyltransferase